MIRFSAALVVAGLGLLLTGAITSDLPLIYAAIVVSVCAALVLAVGVIAGRKEIFGRGAAAGADERAVDRGETPGPGAVAIPEEAVSTGPQPLAGRGPAAVFAGPARAGEAEPAEVAAGAPDGQSAAAGASPAAAGPGGPSSSGLGWPPGKSPSEELWARVDAELSAAGASVRAAKLTKEPAAEEVREADRATSPDREAPAGGDALSEPDTPAEPDALPEPDAPAGGDALSEPEAPADRDPLTEPDNPADLDTPGDRESLPVPDRHAAPDAQAEPDTPAGQDTPAEPDAPAEPSPAQARSAGG